MNKLRHLIFLLIVVLSLNIISAAIVEIDSCQTLSVNGQTYLLNNSISNGSTCFTITADNVILDGDGHSLTGTDAGGSKGIYANNRLNLTIKNFGNISKYSYNLHFDAVNNSRIINNYYSFPIGSGLVLEKSQNNTIRNNTAERAIDGIYFLGDSKDNLIEANTFFGGYSGFYMDGTLGGNVFLNNNIYNNTLNIEDISTGTKAFIYNNSYGQIVWTAPSFLSNLDLAHDIHYPGNITIKNNSVFVDSAYVTELNKPANVTLYGIGDRGYANPEIFKDGVICTDCYNFTALTASTVIFNVTGFSTYTINDSDVTAPNVTSVIPATGSSFNNATTQLIGADVADDFVVDVVIASITFPNGTIQNLTLYNSAGISYNNNFTTPNLAGTYDVLIIANDSVSNINNTETTSFTVTLVNPISYGICQDSDSAILDAAAVASALFVIIFIATILGLLISVFSGKLSPSDLGESMSFENLPKFIMLISLTYLLLATMSFIIITVFCT